MRRRTRPPRETLSPVLRYVFEHGTYPKQKTPERQGAYQGEAWELWNELYGDRGALLARWAAVRDVVLHQEPEARSWWVEKLRAAGGPGQWFDPARNW